VTVDPKAGGDDAARATPPPDRSAVLDLAAALRTTLRFHQQLGVDRYPLSPGFTEGVRPPGDKPGPPKPAVLKPTEEPSPERNRSRPVDREMLAAQMQALREDIAACRLCSLVEARQGVVAGIGAAGVPLLVVGDYSGQEAGFSATVLFGAAEDAMLGNMMRAIGLTPEQVYVTNAIKCCPLPAAPPGDECLRLCREHLLREIELVRPRVVCAMGEAAARALVGGRESVVRLRGRFHPLREAGEGGRSLQVMVTFHPRLLLKNAELKKATWQDLQMIQRLLRTA